MENERVSGAEALLFAIGGTILLFILYLINYTVNNFTGFTPIPILISGFFGSLLFGLGLSLIINSGKPQA